MLYTVWSHTLLYPRLRFHVVTPLCSLVRSLHLTLTPSFRLCTLLYIFFFTYTATSKLYTLSLHLPFLFFFNDTATTEIYTLSLHDALPICRGQWRESARARVGGAVRPRPVRRAHARHGRARVPAGLREWRRLGPRHHDERLRGRGRSEEHTSELQSPCNLVCRLLLEKKNNA